MTAGAFTPAARDAIYEAAGWRCVGCGRADPLTCQHRRARGMGGTSLAAIGEAPNGIALCGSGSTGCHGWTEAHPAHARTLGWRLGPAEDPFEVPYWTRYGWRLWHRDLTVSSFEPWGDLAPLDAAIAAYQRAAVMLELDRL